MGVNFTLNHLGEEYFVVQGRQQVKRCIKECAEYNRRFRKTADGTITQNSIRDDLETICQLCNRFPRTCLHNARTRQTTDEVLLMPICVFTDTLLPLRNGHFPGNGYVLKCADMYGGSTRVAKIDAQ